MSKTKTTKKAAAPKATKSAKAPKAAPAKKADATKPAAKKAKATNGEAKAKKVSAIDAAAQVLAGAKEPMNAKQMIEAMAAKGLWTSPGGKTPHATLYSAILREINEKGKDARFKKTERGRFAANA
ncbi:MAG: winged helix-turn-helix domain-containing protein [Pirellulaceae bacterium]|nr:winged helix-turn-helix domain-containing protein [Pirellulaceae bacterium]